MFIIIATCTTGSTFAIPRQDIFQSLYLLQTQTRLALLSTLSPAGHNKITTSFFLGIFS